MKLSQLGKDVLVNKVVAGYVGINRQRSRDHHNSGTKEMPSRSDEHLCLARLNRFKQAFWTDLCHVRIVSYIECLIGEILSSAVGKIASYQQLVLRLPIQHYFARINFHPLRFFIRTVLLAIRSTLADPIQNRLIVTGTRLEPFPSGMGHRERGLEQQQALFRLFQIDARDPRFGASVGT